MKPILNSLSFCLLLLLSACSATIPKAEKINGVSFVASREAIEEKHVVPVMNLNANYAAVMPFGFVQDLAHPEIRFDNDRQWFGERKEGVMQYVKLLKDKNIRIMLKPQLWVRKGEFTGFIKMTNEADWNTFEQSYSQFILAYAQVAKDVHAEIFCIGTELESFVDERPDFWFQLIVDIKKVYKGKLTYAANWNEYHRTPFWDELHYIGVDAYFPLSNEKTPTLPKLIEGWQPHKLALSQFSATFEKPILFTEYGYRSVDFSAKEPWKADRNMVNVNFEAQANPMQSLFEEVWNEDWFAGGFVWKWFYDYDKSGGKGDSQFTPQNKPVETIIKEFYTKN